MADKLQKAKKYYKMDELYTLFDKMRKTPC